MESKLQEEAKQYMDGHHWEEAIPILLSDISENPDDPWSPMYLSCCFYELGDYSSALIWARKAEFLDPKNPTPFGLQGDALHCLGRVENARDCYLRALKLDPNNSLAIKNWERFQQIEMDFPNDA